MVDKVKTLSPPYATFGAFMSFINKLRDTVIPGRIDATVFGNASGSLVYSVIASLKFLKLINDSGTPSETFIALVKAPDDVRPSIMQKIVKEGYPSLFRDGVNLTTMTAGQFDEHMRTEFGVQGSTVDKIALFFAAACKAADIPLSLHLLARKPIASSAAAKKSVRQRRDAEDGGGEGDDGAKRDRNPPGGGGTSGGTSKALEYQLIDLMSEPDIDAKVKESIWALVQYLTARKAKDPK